MCISFGAFDECVSGSIVHCDGHHPATRVGDIKTFN